MSDRLKEGELLFAKGKIKEAKKCFIDLLEEDPENSEALNNLGVICHALGKIQEAEDYFLKALAIKGDYLDPLLNLADLYQSVKRWKEAAIQLEKYISINNQDPNKFNQLGLVYLEMGNTQKAREALKRSLDLNPDQEIVRESLEELEKRYSDPICLPEPGSFRAAFIEIDITPRVSENNPVFLQGFGGPLRRATSVSTPLMMHTYPLCPWDHLSCREKFRTGL